MSTVRIAGEAGLFAASLICAVSAAQFSMSVSAAVPVEESVQEGGRAQQENSRAQQENSRAQQESGRAQDRNVGTQHTPDRRDTSAVLQPGSPSDADAGSSSRNFDIPPTIEPPPAESAWPAGPAGNAPSTAGGYTTATPAPSPTFDSDTGSGQLGQTFYQLQVLQQELQSLRGQVEQQGYLIKRLQRDQQEQYLDLDKRVVALYTNEPAPGPTATVPQAPAAAPGQSGGSLSEREAYEAAFDAMRKQEFERSLTGFRLLIENYPNGQYTPNAYYWIGELHLAAQSEPELARQSFVQVVNLYPDHPKTPDALYKLGVVYHSLGDSRTALQYLQQVQQDYPGTSVAGLAAKYAAEIQ